MKKITRIKKNIVFILFLTLLILFGCGKKEDNQNNENHNLISKVQTYDLIMKNTKVFDRNDSYDLYVLKVRDNKVYLVSEKKNDSNQEFADSSIIGLFDLITETYEELLVIDENISIYDFELMENTLVYSAYRKVGDDMEASISIIKDNKEEILFKGKILFPLETPNFQMFDGLYYITQNSDDGIAKFELVNYRDGEKNILDQSECKITNEGSSRFANGCKLLFNLASKDKNFLILKFVESSTFETTLKFIDVEAGNSIDIVMEGFPHNAFIDKVNNKIYYTMDEEGVFNKLIVYDIDKKKDKVLSNDWFMHKGVSNDQIIVHLQGNATNEISIIDFTTQSYYNYIIDSKIDSGYPTLYLADKSLFIVSTSKNKKLEIIEYEISRKGN